VKLARLALAALLLPLAGAAASVSIQYDNGVFRVVGETFRSDQASAEASGLVVHIEGSAIPLFGTYSVENGQLSFRPRFPLSPDLTYVAALGSGEAGSALVLPAHKQTAAPTTRVLAMYPSSPVLPDNQLKLYLVFSAPMQGGDGIFSKIHLIDSNGAPAYLPFVQQDLWNRNYTRLTLIFDPGRIKRGVKPNVDMGPVLTEGKHYSLIIDRDLKDGNGSPLAEAFRHDFAAGPSERRGIDPARWKLSEPHAGTTEPLVVTFDRPLDYALLQDVFQIPGVEGKATVGAGETEWRFQPAQPWKAGEHSLIVDMALEDLAGNRIGRPFDVDMMVSPAGRITSDTASLTFRVQ
jgi:hypothetical protein